MAGQPTHSEPRRAQNLIWLLIPLALFLAARNSQELPGRFNEPDVQIPVAPDFRQ